MTTSEDNKKSIAFKIKALLTKTTQAGCSEAEAMMAAHKAKELLDKYQIDLSELDLREEGTDETEVQMSAISRDLSGSVAAYCEVKSWRDDYKHHYLGLKSDVFFAEWLLLALTSFVQRKTLDYSLNTVKIYQNDVAEFQIGCAKRIRERLQAEVEARKAERSSTGRELIIVKDQLVTEAWAKKNLQLSGGSRPRQALASQHYMAGHSAGGEARFSRPVSRDEFQTKALPAK